jgi:NADPH:quinone reductase
MKAVLIRRFGDPEVLSHEDVDVPAVADDEVLVRVHSVSVNRTLDVLVRQGRYPRAVSLPLVLGNDPAGTVEALGSEVRGLRAGQRVAVSGFVWCGACRYCRVGEDDDCLRRRTIGMHRWGGYAEYVSVPAASVVALPDGMSFAEAVFVVRHLPTAVGQLERSAALTAGETVLVMGASGALGMVSVQLAKLLGARVVAGVGSDEGAELAREIGADLVVDYRRQDLADEVNRFTEGRGVDVVSENVGDPDLWRAAVSSLGHRGRLVTAGAHGGGRVTLDVRSLYMRRHRIIGAVGSSRRDVDRAVGLAREHSIRTNIALTLPLTSVREAHEIVERRSVRGKVLLVPDALHSIESAEAARPAVAGGHPGGGHDRPAC